jgi:hypothetical protein
MAIGIALGITLLLLRWLARRRTRTLAGRAFAAALSDTPLMPMAVHRRDPASGRVDYR